jgi:hypothetical protein
MENGLVDRWEQRGVRKRMLTARRIHQEALLLNASQYQRVAITYYQLNGAPFIPDGEEIDQKIHNKCWFSAPYNLEPCGVMYKDGYWYIIKDHYTPILAPSLPPKKGRLHVRALGVNYQYKPSNATTIRRDIVVQRFGGNLVDGKLVIKKMPLDCGDNPYITGEYGSQPYNLLSAIRGGGYQ